MTHEEIFVLVAGLMNDTGRDEYTNAVILPYYNIARLELQQDFQLNNVPVTNETSDILEVPSGTTSIGFAPNPPIPNTPYLPSNLKEIRRLWYSVSGQNSWFPVTKRDYLTQDELSANSEVSYFSVWAWMNQEIRLLPANTDLDLKLDYIQSLFSMLVIGDIDEEQPILNAELALQYRTAGLCAYFVAEDVPRANKLDGLADHWQKTNLGIATKGRQSITVRRQPFRAAYKNNRRLL